MSPFILKGVLTWEINYTVTLTINKALFKLLDLFKGWKWKCFDLVFKFGVLEWWSEPAGDTESRTSQAALIILSQPLQGLSYGFCLSSLGLLWGYVDMFSDKQFRIPNNFRFSFIVVIFRKNVRTGFHMTCLN